MNFENEQVSSSEQSQQRMQNVPETIEEEKQSDSDMINDEEMIEIAEKVLIRITQKVNSLGIDFREIFAQDLILEEIEGHRFELLAPMHFLEGLS